MKIKELTNRAITIHYVVDYPQYFQGFTFANAIGDGETAEEVFDTLCESLEEQEIDTFRLKVPTVLKRAERELRKEMPKDFEAMEDLPRIYAALYIKK